mmetsp:Transcript_3333/g.7120  ORF Transcript_3333/g.7120 Transcript_3333/m.7120 type:complete len:239 (-) Transcript_3333:1280-1996(-)
MFVGTRTPLLPLLLVGVARHPFQVEGSPRKQQCEAQLLLFRGQQTTHQAPALALGRHRSAAASFRRSAVPKVLTQVVPRLRVFRRRSRVAYPLSDHRKVAQHRSKRAPRCTCAGPRFHGRFRGGRRGRSERGRGQGQTGRERCYGSYHSSVGGRQAAGVLQSREELRGQPHDHQQRAVHDARPRARCCKEEGEVARKLRRGREGAQRSNGGGAQQLERVRADQTQQRAQGSVSKSRSR